MSESGLYTAYSLRFMKSIKMQVILYLVLTFGFIAILIGTAYFDPYLFTDTTRITLEKLASKYLSGIHGLTYKESLLVVLTAIYTPFVVALISSLMAASSLNQIIANDKENGLFEVLLSLYIDKSKIMNVVLLYSILAGLILLAIVSSVFSAIVFLVLNILHFGVMFTSYYAKLLLLLAPSVTLLSSIISLYVSVKLTSFSTKRFGLSAGNIGTLISSLPGLIPIILVSLEPDFNVTLLSGIITFFSIILFVFFLLISNKYVKSTDLIE